jgi:hypothetical protein
VQHPDPGEGAKCYFQRAGPVDAALEGIVFEPAFQLIFDIVVELLPPGEPVRLREQDKVLVAVKFPDDLMISGTGGVQIRNSSEIDGGRFNAGEIVAAPPDSLFGRNFHAEYRKPAAQNILGQTLALEGEIRSGELAEDRLRGREERERERARTGRLPDRRKQAEYYVSRFLPQAELDLRRASHEINFPIAVTAQAKTPALHG